ncbi:MAG: hypothetical protein ACI35O_01125 [Bacillaceae bacterium]
MKHFISTLTLIFFGLFCGTVAIFIFFPLLFGQQVQTALPFGVTILIVGLVFLQGRICYRAWKNEATKADGMHGFLGILVGLFVWYFTCGQLVAVFYY